MKSSSLANLFFGPWIRDISVKTMQADLVAGLLGSILVLPQAIAFALLAGLPAQYGLYTAVVPCVIAALFGSSRQVVSGPTNANSLALFAMLTPLAVAGSPEYIQMALVVTVLVGLIQAAVGLLRIGTLANLISPSVLYGFMVGAGALIALQGVGDMIGVAKPPGQHSAPATALHYIESWRSINPASLVVGLVTIVAAIAIRRLGRPRLPYMLIGLIAATLTGLAINAVGLLSELGQVAQVGALPSPIPAFEIPDLNWSQLPDLFSVALALSIVALGQSISIAKAMATRCGQTIDPNKEFWGQGLSNIIGGFFSCYVSCGSLNRSIPNAEAGAQTPLAAVASALLLVLLVAIFGNWLQYLPMAGIGALLVLVAWSLMDMSRWARLWRLDKIECMIALTTALSTIFLQMEIAILLGTLLSLLVYLSRTAKPAVRIMGFTNRDRDRHLDALEPKELAVAMLCPQLQMVRVEGDVYFGATNHVATALNHLRDQAGAPKHLLVMARSMNFIDLSGAELWENERHQRLTIGGDIYFHRPRERVTAIWEKTGFLKRLGADHIFPTKSQAITAIFSRLDPEICRNCRVRAFQECGYESSERSEQDRQPHRDGQSD